MSVKNYFIKFFICVCIFTHNKFYNQEAPCCVTCRSPYYSDYLNENTFDKVGLDIYVLDYFDSTHDCDNFFKKYYEHFYNRNKKNKNNKIVVNNNININNNNKDDDNEPNDIDAEDEDFRQLDIYNKHLFFKGEKEVLDFSNYQKEWRWHIYKKSNDPDDNKRIIEKITKIMSTEGGNNFNWETLHDEPRWFEPFRSKVRHNKNVFIVKIDGLNDQIIKEVLSECRNFVNMSYIPMIIFTSEDKVSLSKEVLLNKIEEIEKEIDNTEFKDKIKNIKDRIEEENEKEEDAKEYGTECKKKHIPEKGEVDFREHIDDNLYSFIAQDKDFVQNVTKRLEEAESFHNNICDEKELDGISTFNILITGWKRSGKSTLTNIILNGLFGKAANDFTSVTRKIAKYFNPKEVRERPIAVLDTPGVEGGTDYVDEISKYIDEHKKEIHVIIHVINTLNFPEPENFGNLLYKDKEKKLFEKFKEFRIPVVFVVNRAKSFMHGIKYIRKIFGDLALEEEFSHYKQKDGWQCEKQWLHSSKIRNTIVQLKDNNDGKGKYGLVRLFDIIKDLINKSERYKKRLPEYFGKEGDNEYTFDDFIGAMQQNFKDQGFKDDLDKDDETNIFYKKKEEKVYDHLEGKQKTKYIYIDYIKKYCDESLDRCMKYLHEKYYDEEYIYLNQLAINTRGRFLINKFAIGKDTVKFMTYDLLLPGYFDQEDF